MSRDLLHVTIHLPHGKPLEGIGRNLPATIERVYNKAFGKQHGRHAVMLEHLPSGHANESDHRYEGTFHGTVTDDSGASQPFTVDSRIQAAAKPGKVAAAAAV